MERANRATNERDFGYRPRPIYQMVPNGERSISIVLSSRFGFDNGCRGICACSLVVRQRILPAGEETLCPPRLTVDAFTLSPFYTVCGDGAVDTLFAITYDGFWVACALRQ